jgi:hypothetical protein
VADDRRFEEMTDPPLADRLRAFEEVLLGEPCGRGGACDILSDMGRMCPPCRLRLRFFHIVRNAEAYEGTVGEIPRRRV